VAGRRWYKQSQLGGVSSLKCQVGNKANSRRTGRGPVPEDRGRTTEDGAVVCSLSSVFCPRPSPLRPPAFPRTIAPNKPNLEGVRMDTKLRPEQKLRDSRRMTPLRKTKPISRQSGRGPGDGNRGFFPTPCPSGLPWAIVRNKANFRAGEGVRGPIRRLAVPEANRPAAGIPRHSTIVWFQHSPGRRGVRRSRIRQKGRRETNPGWGFP
jgi:hypothetical protein